MLRCLPLVLVIVIAGGCGKPKDLPDLTVRSADAGELAAFKSELGGRFTPEQLKPLDTALQELQLDAMDRNVPTAEAREQDMLKVVDGKTVREALVLGWQARHRRFLRETALLTGLLDNDLKLQQKTAATGTPQTVLDRIQSEKTVIAQLQANLAETDRQLTEWGVAPGPVTASKRVQKP